MAKKSLLKTEAARLKECEKVVEKGMATFVEVGQALAIIRDSKLYRDTHKSFEAYCKDRWGRTRDWAYKLISSSTAVKNVDHGRQKLPKFTNERQAREVARAPEEKQAEVWKEATKSGAPTAAKVREVVEDFEEEESEEEEYDPIPEMAEPYKRAVRDLDRIKRELKAAFEDKQQRKHVESFYGRVDGILKSARSAINQATPAAMCGKCGGDGCNTCLQTGYWTKQLVSSRRNG